MARCERYEEALWDAAETGAVSAELERHLEACPACREELATLHKAMTGFTELRRMPERVPAVALAPLLPATRWWPRVAFAGVIVMLAVAAISIFLLSRKPSAPVAKEPPKPTIQHEHPEQSKPQAPIIVWEEKPPQEPRIARHAEAPVRHRRVAKISRHLAPVTVKQEQSTPAPQPLPVPEFDPAEALISAQPVSTLMPLAATALPAESLTAVSDLPLTYALIPVKPEEIQQLLNPESTPEDGRAPGERPDVVSAPLDGARQDS